jgi:hypothetical protein
MSDPRVLADYLRFNAMSVWHISGTCRMGTPDDPMAVVDSAGRVYGIENLRVADASIMPSLPRANTNIPVIMFAEKISQSILERSARFHGRMLGRHCARICQLDHCRMKKAAFTSWLPASLRLAVTLTLFTRRCSHFGWTLSITAMTTVRRLPLRHVLTLSIAGRAKIEEAVPPRHAAQVEYEAEIGRAGLKRTFRYFFGIVPRGRGESHPRSVEILLY